MDSLTSPYSSIDLRIPQTAGIVSSRVYNQVGAEEHHFPHLYKVVSEVLSISSSRIAEIVDLGSRSNYNIPLLLVPGKSQGGAVMLMLMIALSAYKDRMPRPETTSHVVMG